MCVQVFKRLQVTEANGHAMGYRYRTVKLISNRKTCAELACRDVVFPEFTSDAESEKPFFPARLASMMLCKIAYYCISM